MAEQIISTVDQQRIEKAKSIQQQHADDQRKVNPGEKIVSPQESADLQKDGKAEVLAVFEIDGKKVHKVKLVEEVSKKGKKSE